MFWRMLNFLQDLTSVSSLISCDAHTFLIQWVWPSKFVAKLPKCKLLRGYCVKQHPVSEAEEVGEADTVEVQADNSKGGIMT